MDQEEEAAQRTVSPKKYFKNSIDLTSFCYVSFSLFRTLCNDTTKQTKVTIVTIPKNPQCDLHVHAYLNQTLIITYYETKHIVQDEKKM